MNEGDPTSNGLTEPKIVKQRYDAATGKSVVVEVITRGQQELGFEVERIEPAAEVASDELIIESVGEGPIHFYNQLDFALLPPEDSEKQEVVTES